MKGEDMAVTAIKERPILMCGPMIRATLEDMKTQTRRIVSLREFGPSDTPGYQWHFRDRRGLWNDISTERLLELCPHGEVGTRLWVRETWYTDDGRTAQYRADYGHGTREPADIADRGQHWRPSIFMPRWASRILLEITEVRVQRVQEISDDDVKSEGVLTFAERYPLGVSFFKPLWDSLNAKRGYGWDKNPWVWVLGFRRIT